MQPYSNLDIRKIYKSLIRKASKKVTQRKYTDAIHFIKASARWAYDFNLFFTDFKVECLLKQISEQIAKPVKVEKHIYNRCVLIDSFCLANRGLTQQYLRAMMSNDMEIMLIYTKIGGIVDSDIIEELKSYNKYTIITFNNTDEIKQTKEIIKRITDFSPKHIFLHITPWETVGLMACHLIRDTDIYNINLTDHAYWIGSSFIDYNIEFRPYGKTISLEKRGLKEDQLLQLPYYPLNPINRNSYELPNLPINAVRFLTGGSPYKMLGKNDIFFKIMECVLSVGDNVYILVAGFNDGGVFNEKLKRIKGNERVFLIGNRKDIDSVFARCDIYLGTYPVAGGLMSQYAAKNGKPIVAYHEYGESKLEEVVNHFQHDFKTFTCIKQLTEYVRKLVVNKDFRLQEGLKLQKGLMTEDRFNISFVKVISERKKLWNWENDYIDYNAISSRYIDLENKNGYASTKRLVKNVGKATFTMPECWHPNLIEMFLKLKMQAIKKYI